ncbi:hypothetical protein [uncultured Chryseobacterium sp.]|uniref:hypothetical protein n=1 Tax=uncultured Chryseobacterium sp. TaxID=259322 RepID=UPI0025E36000|nr:hypothetical protein [uncultured Chryseobacterium sp.]
MKINWKISFLLTVIFLFLLSCWNYRNRVFDWDMPGYIGCLYSLKFPQQPDKVRILTYRDIRKEAPEIQYQDILGLQPADKARQAFANNTKAFREQLPYYQIKIGYTSAVLILYELGFTSPQSVLLLSSISYFVSGILFFFLMKIIFPKNAVLAAFLTAAVLLLPPMIHMARIPTPDMFLFQFMLLFMLGLLKKVNQWAIFAILIMIVFARPDYILFALTYLAVRIGLHYFNNGKLNGYFFLQGLVLVLFYMAIIRLCHYPGWKSLFYDSFIYRRPVISAQSPDFSFHDYLDILFHRIIYFKRVSVMSLTLLILIFSCSKDLENRIFALLIFVNIYIKFLFFPHAAGMRFFFIFIIMLLVIFLNTVSHKYNGFRLRKIA